MTNKYLKPFDSTLISNKLGVLLERLEKQLQDGTFQTQQETVQEILKAIRKFYEDDVGPLLKLRDVKPGTPPIRNDYNDLFEETGQDLTVIFKELSTLENLVLKNFNFMVSERDSVTKLLKRVDSKLGDYILYVDEPTVDTMHFLDSFNDVSRTDFGAELLESKQCEILPAEGIVTLPIIRDGTENSKAAKVTVNANSNGTIGNYQELYVAPHDDINDILDSNPDTWFEYERVQSTLQENIAPLVLDLTFYFDKTEIINHIRVNPNNFGTVVPTMIDNIQTSYDGKEWTSIKDDIPVLDFIGEDEEDIFTLAPSTSKFAGQGLYTFTPRKVKYVRITLQQDTAYTIDTSSGPRYRYAIGLRDVEFFAHRYEAKGEIISLPFNTDKEIQKISLIAGENPVEQSVLADIRHQVSIDDGSSWHDIQPQARSGMDTPEILNINTSDTDAIMTANPVYSVRHRMIFERDASKFVEGVSELARKTKKTAELFAIPSRSPLKFALSRPPIDGTVSLINPIWGGRDLIPGDNAGLPGATGDNKLGVRKYVLGISNGRQDEFDIPLDLLELDISLDEVYIWIDNVRWLRVGAFSEKTLDPWFENDDIYLCPTSRVYTLSREGKLRFRGPDNYSFGQGEQQALGAIPPAGSVVSFTLQWEYLSITPNPPHTSTLLLPTDGEKSNVKIFRIGRTRKTTPALEDPGSFKLKGGVTSWNLPHKSILYPPGESFCNSTEWFKTNAPGDSRKVDYIDGETEFLDDFIPAGGYTQYWSLDADKGRLYSSVVSPADEDLYVYYIYYDFQWLSESDWDFVKSPDGLYQEIEINENVYVEEEATLTIDNAYDGHTYIDTGGGTFGFRMVPKSVKLTSAMLANDPTPHQVPFVDGVAEFTQVSGDIETDGLYSIDIKEGIIYLGGELEIDAEEEHTLAYNFTRYGVLYNMARPLESDEYTLDIANGEIEIDDKEALRIWSNRYSDVKNDALVRVSYEYAVDTGENVKDLEPYFSPVCRAFALKILPIGSLEY